MTSLTRKEASAKQEKTVAKYLGWDVVSGSGARPTHQGDLISEVWLGECKTHVSPGKSIQFGHTVWFKISDEATAKFRVPVLIVDDGSQELCNTFCMFPMHMLKSVNSRWKLMIDNQPIPIKHLNASTISFKLVDAEFLNNFSETRVPVWSLMLFPCGRRCEKLSVTSLKVFKEVILANA